MKDNKEDSNNFRDSVEAAYFLILPILCIAALLRGCSASKAPAPAPEMTQQEVAQQSEGTADGVTVNAAGGAVLSQKTGETEADTAQEVGSGSGPSEAYAAEKKITVKRNPYDPDKFEYVDGTENITYADDNYESLQGIDVSDHQGEIDWDQVADAGYDFVFVRVGFRGYGEEGTLNEDTMAIEYMQDAEEAGLEIGAYFFSQAVNEEEAAEEARFAADVIKRSGCKVALYTNLFWENTYFDLDALNDFEIWYADYEEVPQTSCHFTWWQYSETGYVPGIKGAMDLNLWIRNRD